MKSLLFWLLGGLIVFAFFMAKPGFIADYIAPEDNRIKADRALGTLLRQDGTSNQPSGFNGSVDAAGWKPESGPSAEPRFIRKQGLPWAEKVSVAGDELWDSQFALGVQYTPQPDSRAVYAIAVSGANVYIGGDFDRAGEAFANNIARWDSTAHKWSSLGSGVNGRVKAIAAQGNDVYVGGYFTIAGGVNAKYIARWNGATQTWSALGGELTHSNTPVVVNAIATDSGGMVYVGGEFEKAGGVTVNNIARWTGSSWQALGTGTGGPEHTVYAVAASSSAVYIGGRFSVAGGTNCHNMARWNGSAWSELGNGVNDEVNAIAVDGNNVYIGGRFTLVSFRSSPLPAGYVAMWNGSAWNTLGGGMAEPDVSALAVGPDGIYAGGRFNGVVRAGGGSTLAYYVARWDGSAWSAVPNAHGPLTGGGVDSNVYALAFSFMDNSIYAGGFMSNALGRSVNSIARWSIADGDWYALGNSVNGPIFAMAVDGDDIYVGGDFNSAGGIPANNIAVWNGNSQSWSALGSGVKYCTGHSCVRTSVQSIDIFGGVVYIGGDFVSAGGVPVNSIAAWNISSQTWSALSGGVTGGGGGGTLVKAIDSSTFFGITAGGRFNTAGVITAKNIANWVPTYSSWFDMPSGTNADVNAVLYLNSTLYIGGYFSSPANYMAKWEGQKWNSIVGGSPNGGVSAIVEGPSPFLYIGGRFTDLGGPSGDYVAMYDHLYNTWGTLGSGFNDAVLALSNRNDALCAGGDFTASGATSISRVARFSGGQWQAIGSGADDTVAALADDGQFLYIGGHFLNAGGKPSAYFGRWGQYRIHLPILTK